MKKTLSIILIFLLSVTLAVNVFGAEPAWTLSKDETALSDGTYEYIKYPLSYADVYNPPEAYVYSANIVLDGESHDVSKPMNAEHIVALGYHNTQYFYQVYVTAEGEKLLDEFFGGDYGFARIQNYNQMFGGVADISLDVLNALDTLDADSREFDVRVLEDAPQYELLVYDKSDSIEHIHGALYEIDGEHWYINYDALDNAYFDSGGYFSYRKGTVTANKVPYDQMEILEDAYTSVEERFTDYYYYDGTDFDEDNLFEWEEAGIVYFWIIAVIVGFVFPLTCAVLGIVFASSKKPGNNKRWLTLTVVALFMLIVAFVMVLMLILP